MSCAMSSRTYMPCHVLRVWTLGVDKGACEVHGAAAAKRTWTA